MRAFDLSEPLTLGPVIIPCRVFQAPLSGISDLPFRRRALAHGAAIAVSEMVASGELAKGRAGSERRIRREGIGLHVVQLAGREAVWMAEGARIAEGEGADIIDINMGCPARKVTGGACGSALMRDIDHATSLVDAVVAAVSVPVTVKMRLGWDETALNAPALARRVEAVGARMITVHGRTRCQFYQGKADWRAIARVKEAVSVPVVANGDIGSLADAREALRQSGADAVMVGRAGCGAPWAAGEIARIAGRRDAAAATPPDAAEIAGYVAAHYEDMLIHYGMESGMRQARKHLGWYLDKHAAATPPQLRQAIMTGLDAGAILAAIRHAFEAAAASVIESKAA